MKSKLFSFLFLSIFLISCSETKEEMLKKLNANKETPSISSIELRDNYENLKDKPVVFEGVVGLSCCGSREIALIDLEDFIQSNGDNIHVALNFSKEELQLVRSFTTGMYIKVVGFVGYKSKSVSWESNYNRGMETSIDLKDCIILSSNSSSNNTSNITTNDNDETSSSSVTYKFNCAPPNGTNRILDKPDTNAIHSAYIGEYKGGGSLGTSWTFLGNKMIVNSQGKFLYGDIYSPRGGQLNIKENGYNGPVYVYFKDWDCNIEIPK